MPLGTVVNLRSALAGHLHRRLPIRQAIEHPGSPYRRKVAGVEAEEVDARLAVVGHVGPDVDFVEAGKPRQRWHARRSEMVNPEWRDRNPGALAIGVQRENVGNPGAYQLRIERIVQEQQVVPALRHDPWRHGRGPWAMCGGKQDGIGAHPLRADALLIGFDRSFSSRHRLGQQYP